MIAFAALVVSCVKIAAAASFTFVLLKSFCEKIAR
jgi:hypothetical protein